MCLKNRSNKKELLDNISLNSIDLRKNLDEMETLNCWFGSKKLLINALNEVERKYRHYFNKHKIVIGDLGCGNGDLLRAVDQWAKLKHVNTELIGIDTNSFIIQYANDKSRFHDIQFITENILSSQFKQYQFDIVSLNSVCHHFTDEELIQLFQNLIKQTRIAIIVNDLQRHWLSLYAIKFLSRFLHFSYLSKNDAPLSVMRAFRKQELIHLLAQANIKSYQLHWTWAFRWKLLIWCRTPDNN